MPVPTSIDDLSTTAASNSPSGSDTPKDGDNYIRALSAFVATLRDKLNGTSNTGTVKAATFSGTHTFSSGNLISGTYTPTAADVSNVTSGAVETFVYMRVGSVVYVNGNVSVTPTASGSECVLTLTLPIASSLTDTHQLSGVVTRNESGGTEAGRCFAQPTGDLAFVRFYARNTSAGYAAVSFSYQVL